MQAVADIATALRAFGGDPQKAGPLAAFLGFQPITAPQDQLAGPLRVGLKQFFSQGNNNFGVKELYRVGSYEAKPASVGLWVAVLTEWGERSTDRDRARRRIARALVEQVNDRRTLVILVPNELQRGRQEAEFVLPRSAAGGTGGDTVTGVTSIRAHISLQDPTRFHRDLLRDLILAPGLSLLEVSLRWQQHFSVERVTTKFYQEYMKVRDRVADALLAHNTGHPVVKDFDQTASRAWATRQVGRMLFLWFLQSKQWLGYDGSGRGSTSYLLELWGRRAKVADGFYQGMLVPLFTVALARRNPPKAVRDLLGFTPYLNGGLFRHNVLEERIAAEGPVTLPDSCFDPENDGSVLGFLSRYRFTTRESTPDDQSVDPDPELLGRVFENLYQADERHDTGTYYTPREIVHFMCRQALDGYLQNQTGVTVDTLTWLRSEVTDPDDSDRRLDPDTEARLVDALGSVRVCDPAVGSGAFLVGMMQEIVRLRLGVLRAAHRYFEDEKAEVALWKRNAIQWSLYGVDLNPEAVEICQLRLWLSLVLELDDPRTVDPLPNLDFRIVAGDSLVDRVANITFSESLPRGDYQAPMELGDKVGQEERNIARWQQQFEGTFDNPQELSRLARNIRQARLRIVRFHVEGELDKAKGRLQALNEKLVSAGIAPRDRKRFERDAESLRDYVAYLEEIINTQGDDKLFQKPFLWPVTFPLVFGQGGFDIVVANPPYIRQEKLGAIDQLSYSQSFKEVYSGTADILVFFYARALQILRPGGWLAFITSNKYMRGGYGEELREYLPQSLAMHRVIDFGDLPLFEANGKQVAAYPAVLVGRKERDTQHNALSVADLTYAIRQRLTDANLKVNTENVRL